MNRKDAKARDQVNYCALCLQRSELRVSHIIPAFVARYLRETSATGFLRRATEPDLRVQDIAKKPLLCDCCEQLFSRWERQFAEHAFPRVQDDNFRGLSYGPWLLKFAVSLSWRVMVSNKEELIADLPQFATVVGKTLEDWRLFLLDERNDPQSQHHLFILAGMPERVPAEMHPSSLHYLYRSIDATEMISRRTLAVYVKLLRSMFFSPVKPSHPNGWKNTRIHAGNGRITSPQVIAMKGFSDFLNSRIEEVFAKPMSAAQSRKVTETMLKDPERALNSESRKVHVASRKLFHRE